MKNTQDFNLIELNNFIILDRRKYLVFSKPNQKFGYGINLIRKIYLFEMIPSEIFLNEINIINNSINSENNKNLNIN